MVQLELGHTQNPQPRVGSAEHRHREKRKKTRILTKIQRARKELIDRARTIAVGLCHSKGEVTGIQVREEMQRRGYSPLMDEVIDGRKIDPRWMGAVFGKSCEAKWEFVRFELIGSHSSPVRVWRLAP